MAPSVKKKINKNASFSSARKLIKKGTNSSTNTSQISFYYYTSKLAKSAQKVRNDQGKPEQTIRKDTYKGKPVFKLREKDPCNYIQDAPFRYKNHDENNRVREVISKLHPIERQGFDIEGYYHYSWRPEDKKKFLSTREMKHQLSDIRRTMAESTRRTRKNSINHNWSVDQMVEESKSTLRSTEPYIGGEKETGERIHRYRNKTRELDLESRPYSHSKSVNKDRILTSNINKRTMYNTSIINETIDNLTIKIVDKTDEFAKLEYVSTKESIQEKSKIRPVSAYAYSRLKRVRYLDSQHLDNDQY